MLDGVQMNTSNTPQGYTWGAHTIIFHAEGLSENQHTLSMSTQTSTDGWYLDYIVYTTKNSSRLSAPAFQLSSGENRPTTGVIIGGILGGVFLLIVLLVVGFFLKRRKAKTKDVLPLTNRGNSETRSIRSVRSISGASIGRSNSGIYRGIIGVGTSSSTVFERSGIRVSETTSTSRINVDAGPLVASPIQMIGPFNSQAITTAPRDHALTV